MKTKRKWAITIAVLAVLLAATALFFLTRRGQTDISVEESIPRMTVTSTAFENLGVIPDQYTGRGDDISPDFALPGLSESAVSIAIIMDDLDVPVQANFTHWVIWNIPPLTSIPQGIAHGESVAELDGAVQGVAYGSNRYRGPMPPFGTHRYQFHVFALDTMLELDSACGKAELLKAMEGHIVQYGMLTGWYPRQAK